ncbi:MFS transporter [Qipengyuania flava]|uniref:MFS transporter n=1 Tax=Qipengyuania flava TaxID=192812 RepID=UPI001CD5D26E|nr:MFS transporter [Qipengyuania flava]MCA0891788.1 MFS transporter [Qipengyuania flava]
MIGAAISRRPSNLSERTMFHKTVERQHVAAELPSSEILGPSTGARDGDWHGRTAIPLWLAIGCIVLAAMGLRPAIVSVGPIMPSIIDRFELSYAQASMLTAIPTLLMGLLALATPWLVSRFGRDRVIVAALSVLAVSTLGRALSGSVSGLFATTVGVGAGIAIAGALIPGFVKSEYPRRVALLMGVYAMALSLGSTLAAAATGAIAHAFENWRIPAGLWAAPAIIGAIAWLAIAKRAKGEARTTTKVASFPLPVRNGTAWLVAMFFAFNNIAFYSFVSWLAPVYMEQGYSAASAGLILAAFTLAFMIATPLFGAVSKDEDRRVWLALASAISFSGALWIAIAPDQLPYVAVSLLAFGTGGAFTLSMTLPLDNAKTDGEATAWNAFAMTISYSIGAAGPLLVGTLRDASGSFEMPVWMLAAVSCAMLVLTPFLQPHRHRLAASGRRARWVPFTQSKVGEKG